MKKIMLVSTFLIFGYFTSFSQLENRFSIGPRLGANFSNVNSNDTKNLTGLVAGLTSTYSINEKSGITVDLLYSGEGHQRGNQEVERKYLKIPILYNTFWGKLGEAFRPKIYVGFAPGFLIEAEVNNIETTGENNPTVLDIVGGLGFNQRLGNRIWLNADLRAFWGITPIQDSNNSYKNRTLQASLGIAYGL